MCIKNSKNILLLFLLFTSNITLSQTVLDKFYEIDNYSYYIPSKVWGPFQNENLCNIKIEDDIRITITFVDERIKEKYKSWIIGFPQIRQLLIGPEILPGVKPILFNVGDGTHMIITKQSEEWYDDFIRIYKKYYPDWVPNMP